MSPAGFLRIHSSDAFRASARASRFFDRREAPRYEGVNSQSEHSELEGAPFAGSTVCGMPPGNRYSSIYTSSIPIRPMHRTRRPFGEF